MYVADKGREIPRYLKFENVFSSRKHPIYFTYDPNTMETYLTKIVFINSKDERII